MAKRLVEWFNQHARERGRTMRFSDVRHNLREDFSRFPTVKIAILGDTPTQFLHQALKGCGYPRGLNPSLTRPALINRRADP